MPLVQISQTLLLVWIASLRDTVDYGLNKHGHLFTEVLHGSEMFMLNGRNYTNNDFTFVSNRGKSVVDYCVMSQDSHRSVTKNCIFLVTVPARTL